MKRLSEAPSLSAERLASLSDTMFGVAMTLVATTLLPAIQTNRGPILAMLAGMEQELVTVALSFAVSARYWVSQQQRLAMTTTVTPWQTALHLAFLFLIVLIPISSSLPDIAGAAAARASVLIYGAHLLLIAGVHLLLWLEVHRKTVAHVQVARSALTLATFMLALGVGAEWPPAAIYLWVSALATAQFGGWITRRFGGG